MADDEGTGYIVHYEEANEPTDWIEKAGKCKLTYPNGNTFEGTFDDEKKKQGEGTYTWSLAKEEDEEGDGEEEAKPAVVSMYSGNFKNGKKHGKGMLTYPDGARYEGNWHKDKRQGQGRYFYPNRDMYEGNWGNDQKNGTGTYTHAADKSQFIGTWVNGAFVEGKWQYADGGYYEGSFANGVPTGKGVYVMAGGSKVEGAYNKIEVPEGEEPEEDAPTVEWKAGEVTMQA